MTVCLGLLQTGTLDDTVAGHSMASGISEFNPDMYLECTHLFAYLLSALVCSVVVVHFPLCTVALVFSAEKIARLEAENKNLLAQGASAASERLTELENAIDDVTRLKDSFEKVSFRP